MITEIYLIVYMIGAVCMPGGSKSFITFNRLLIIL